MTRTRMNWGDVPRALGAAKVGDRIWFAEEKRPYTVQARSRRYLVCTKPFNARRTVLYSVIDLKEMVRGTENLIFGFGAETPEQCREMIDRLEGRSRSEVGYATEVSHRNRVPLDVVDVAGPAARTTTSTTREGETNG